MLMGTPGDAYGVDEPGVNTVKCPIHGGWLYRQQNIDAEPGMHWSRRVGKQRLWLRCKHKGNRVRTSRRRLFTNENVSAEDTRSRHPSITNEMI